MVFQILSWAEISKSLNFKKKCVRFVAAVTWQYLQVVSWNLIKNEFLKNTWFLYLKKINK
jgi:hypothetical protein